MRLAFLGLGVMGGPMAHHLAQAGHTVHAWTRDASRRAQWQACYGHQPADSAAQAVEGAEVVLLCLGNDDSIRDVVLAQGVLDALPPGAVLVDHTTASAALARELAGLAAERGVGFVDAPVSGGQAGAESGQLTIMCGGLPEHFERVRPLLDAYARRTALLGPPGAGQTAKMANQICLAGLIQGLAEALHFLEHTDLDPAAVISVISRGAAQSWQMDNRHATMLEGEYEHGFAVDWMRKDLAIALAEADRLGASLPVTALVDQFYREVQNMGGGRWDTSSLLKRLQQR